MLVKYGAYSHPINLTNVDVIETKIRNEGHGKYLVNRRLLISGAIKGTSEADIDSKILAINNAYAIDGVSGGLVQSDGSTITQHWLDSPSSYQGVRVVGVRWGGRSKAEFQSFRSFEIEIEADYVSTATDVIAQTEQLEIIGTGGNRNGFNELVSGDPVKQIVNQKTLVRAIQSGSSVWTSGIHSVPPPIWPDFENLDRRRIGGVTLDLNTNRFTRRWVYEFTHVGPLVFPTQQLFTFDNWVLHDSDRLVLHSGDKLVFRA